MTAFQVAVEDDQVEEPSEPDGAWNRTRRYAYPVALGLLYVVWLAYMTATSSWHLFGEHWPVSLTMSLGSFVAGATAEGGAAVAFPVFTKILHIEPTTARTFGLLIQSIGMTFAGIVIVARRVPILPRVILWASAGGIIGQLLGTYWIGLANPYSKILFTFTATVFGVALAVSRWALKWNPLSAIPNWSTAKVSLFFGIGIAGGIVAANTGSGIDMLTFIILTLALGIDEKVSTPTTVIIMAINSIVGAFLHGVVLQDVGIAFDYWMVAIPVVALGAPAGAYFASKATRDHIIVFLLTLITIELVSTILLVPFTSTSILVTAVAVIICAIGFWGMLHYRHNRLAIGDG